MKKLQPGLIVTILALNLLSSCGNSGMNSGSDDHARTGKAGKEKLNDSLTSQITDLNNYLDRLTDPPTNLDVTKIDNKLQDFKNSYKNFKTENNINEYAQLQEIEKDIDSQINSAVEVVQALKNNNIPEELRERLQKSSYNIGNNSNIDEPDKKAILFYLQDRIDTLNSIINRLQTALISFSNNSSNPDDNYNRTFEILLAVVSSLVIILVIVGLISLQYNKSYRLIERINKRVGSHSHDSAKESNSSQFEITQIERQLTTLFNQFEQKQNQKSEQLIQAASQISTLAQKMNNDYEHWENFAQGNNPLRRDAQLNNQQTDVQNNDFISAQNEKWIKDKQDLESVIEDLKQQKQASERKLAEVTQQLQHLQQNHNEELAAQKANLDKYLLDRTEKLETHNQKLESQIRDLNTQKQISEDELTKVKQQLQQFATREQSWQQHITILQQEHDQKLEKEKVEKENINSRFIALENVYKESQNVKDDLNKQLIELQQKLLSLEQSISKTQTLPQNILSLIEGFNSNPNSLEQYAKTFPEVIVDSESYLQHHKDNSKQIILRQPNSPGSGIGLIISPSDGESSGYFLIPKESTVSASEYTQVKYLFKCNNYQEGLRKFILKKPAKVSPHNNQQEWHFEKQDQGEIVGL